LRLITGLFGAIHVNHVTVAQYQGAQVIRAWTQPLRHCWYYATQLDCTMPRMSSSRCQPSIRLAGCSCGYEVSQVHLSIHLLWFSLILCFSWLYTIFLAEDACFKQKARERKHDDANPQLSPGLGVVVDPAKYFSLLNANPGNQDEVSAPRWSLRSLS
jgi:hypothetical protein